MPDLSQINVAVANPDIWMIPAHLKKGKVTTCSIGGIQRPRVCTGNFAAVYKLKFQSQAKAIRIFRADNIPPEKIARIKSSKKILESIKQIFSAAGLGPTFVNFEYIEPGYKIPTREGDDTGKTGPLVVMDWCQGKTLVDFLENVTREKNLQQKKQYLQQLGQLSDKWVDLMKVMHTLGMAHGDLAGENVMIEQGNLVLIDYDGFYANDPVLIRHKPNERGNPFYQHREHEDKREYNQRMDDFSAFVIFLALIAIKEDLERAIQSGNECRLKDFISKDDNRILFEPADYKDPDPQKKESVFEALDKTQTQLVRDIVDIVRTSATGPIDQVPCFTTTMETLIDPVNKLRQLIAATPQDWKAIYHEVMRLQGENVALPAEPELKKVVDDVIARHAAYEELKNAVSQSPTSAKLIAEKATEAWRDCAELDPLELQTVERAKKQVEKLTKLESSEKHDPGYRQVLQLFESCKSLLAGCVESEKWKALAAVWQPRIAACDALMPLIQRPRPWASHIDVANAWDRLNDAGGHPDYEAIKTNFADAIEACRRQRDCLRSIRGLLDRDNGPFSNVSPFAETADRELIALWDQDLLLDCSDVNFRELSQLASTEKRIEILNRLTQKVEQLDTQQLGNEQDVSDAAAKLPQDYQHRWSHRVATSRRRIATHKELNKALTDPISDVRLSDTATAFYGAWEIAIHKPDYDDAVDTRIDRAHTRKDALLELYSLLTPTSDDRNLTERDDRLIANQWNDEIFCEPPESETLCDDAKGIADRVKHAKQRLNAVDTILDAIAGVDNSKINRAPNWAENKNHLVGESLIVVAVQQSGLEETYLSQLEHNTPDRIAQAKQRAELSSRLLALVATTPPCEKQIALTWEDLQRAGGDPIADSHKKRAATACKRRDGLEKLESVLGKRLPADQEDNLLIDVWHVFHLSESHDARSHTERVHLAEQRTEKWPLLERALERHDDFGITSYYDEDILATYPPVAPRIEEILAAKKRSSAAMELLDAIDNDNPKQTAELFDRKHLEAYPERFLNFLPRIEDWKAELFSRYHFEKDLVHPPEWKESNLRVYWKWRGEGRNPDGVFSSAIVGAGQSILHEPEEANKHKEIREDDYTNQKSGALLSIPKEWHMVHVSIWPVIEFTCGNEHRRFVGRPLQLEICRADETIERPRDEKDEEQAGFFEKMLRQGEE